MKMKNFNMSPLMLFQSNHTSHFTYYLVPKQAYLYLFTSNLWMHTFVSIQQLEDSSPSMARLSMLTYAVELEL